MFQAVQFIEAKAGADPVETVLGEYDDEIEAVAAARRAKAEFAVSGSDDYAWWTVRESGAQLANFIADSKSPKEFVLDLSSGELVEVPL
ncbi:MAG TPA: hypothetical protein VFT85_01365 [Acidimicrobiia bacterium]|nr:hypothetical protein [Acidimicrobiia bacterium]